MENEIFDIEFINKYIYKQLSPTEILEFDHRREHDITFHELYNEHVVFVKGMDRSFLKDEIQRAKINFQKLNFLKKLGFGLGGCILIAIVSFYAFTKFIPDRLIAEPIQEKESITTFVENESESESENALSVSRDTLKPSFPITEAEKTPQKVSPSVSSDNGTVFLSEVTPIAPILKEAQIFTLNTSQKRVITCEEGTKITVEADAFKSKETGKPIKETIQLKVSEYYHLDDIILANLTTQSNDELLETGGMLYIEASQNGQELELIKPLEIEFPNKGKKREMQLFTGQEQENTINWLLNERKDQPKVPLLPVNEELANVPFAVIEEKPYFLECKNASNKSSCVREAFNNLIRREFNIELIKQNSKDSTSRIFASFTIDIDGRITKVRTSSPFPAVNDAIVEVLSQAPRMNPGRQRGRIVPTLYSLPITINSENISSFYNGTGDTISTQYRRTPIINDTLISFIRTPLEELKEILHDNTIDVNNSLIDEFKKLKNKRLIRNMTIKGESHVFIRKIVFEKPNTIFKKLPDDSITRGGNVIRKKWDRNQVPDQKVIQLVPRTANSNNYIFSTSRLGWLNCDRFLRSKSPKVKAKIKIKDANGTNVKLIFKNYKSVLNTVSRENDEFHFGELPEDEDIILLALRIRNNQYEIATIDTKIAGLEKAILEFNPTTLDKIKDSIKLLGTKF